MSRRQFLIIFLVTMIFAFIGGICSQSILTVSSVSAQAPVPAREQQTQTGQAVPGKAVEPQGKSIDAYLMAHQWMIGVVKEGKFYVLASGAPIASTALAVPVRLTGIRMQEARSPESAELNLAEYEGKALMVQGHDGGGWIYGAVVVDTGGPLVTALVIQRFGGQE